jgi:hypothetical protein
MSLLWPCIIALSKVISYHSLVQWLRATLTLLFFRCVKYGPSSCLETWYSFYLETSSLRIHLNRDIQVFILKLPPQREFSCLSLAAFYLPIVFYSITLKNAYGLRFLSVRFVFIAMFPIPKVHGRD